jgi:hypothetical protein
MRCLASLLYVAIYASARGANFSVYALLRRLRFARAISRSIPMHHPETIYVPVYEDLVRFHPKSIFIAPQLARAPASRAANIQTFETRGWAVDCIPLGYSRMLEQGPGARVMLLRGPILIQETQDVFGD